MSKYIPRDSNLFSIINDIEELIARIELAKIKGNDEQLSQELYKVQGELLLIQRKLLGGNEDIKQLVNRIRDKVDDYKSKISPPNRYVMPSSSESLIYLDLTRIFARKIENSLLKYRKEDQGVDTFIITYMEMLSLLLFYMRLYIEGKKEI
ncbi:hypothetical protein HS7_05350 [Sulfolobales archaeon HS-7]|nr:hypothetical protein HS7_05350 [Sulfolobales archaeon HS-7]